MFSELFSKILSVNDNDWIFSQTEKLTAIERGQTFKNYKESSEYVFNLLKSEGFDAEMLTFPADGKTVYQDKRMPLAWDATVGKMTVMRSAVPFKDPVVADFSKESFNLIRGSVSTPEGGLYTKLVTEPQALAGEDVTGAFVLLEPETRPTSAIVSMLLDLGAIGFVSEYLRRGLDTPDCVQWVNAATDDHSHWHVQAEDRDFIGFSVSPRIARKLRCAAVEGPLEVLVESDGKRYEGEIDAVTALIPGEDERELWLLAHLYEPLSSDNSLGIMTAINTVKNIQKLIADGTLPKMKHSIRLVFALEFYGFAAVADHFGGKLHNHIGGINIDGVPAGVDDYGFHISIPPYSSPYCGVSVIRAIAECFNDYDSDLAFTDCETHFRDDTFLGDSSTGLPTIWPARATEAQEEAFWHNSYLDMDYLVPERVRDAQLVFTSFAAVMACGYKADEVLGFAVKDAQNSLDNLENKSRENITCHLNGKKACIADFNKIAQGADVAADSLTASWDNEDEITSKWLEYAKGIKAKRETVGLPYDLINIPYEERRALPDGVLYGPFGCILSLLDGERNLCDCIVEAVLNCGRTISDGIVKKYVDAIFYLADYGYISLTNANELTKEDIKKALIELGIKSDDAILLHSSLSGCGNITGGADAILDAFIETVADEGCVISPVFARPYIGFEGWPNPRRTFRPFDPNDTRPVWVGAVPKTIMKRPDHKRSRHVSHPWAGFGKKADFCLNAHSELEPPTNDNSPLGKALELSGKVVFFGCGLASSTFLHYLEYKAKSNFLQCAIVKIKNPDGTYRTEMIKDNLPGHRDFYDHKGLTSKFYTRAIEKGLKINKVNFGIGEIYSIDLKDFYEIGMKLFEEDPNIVLCDKENCLFCRKFRV